ncbi:MAG: hypothetical protein JWN04_3010 [Myxococcaceae bacterium]|nr:hypothetical protein [Myxococcaceae bacterium]
MSSILSIALSDEDVGRIAVQVAKLLATAPADTKPAPARVALHEAADELKCSTRQVRRYVATGRLRASKLAHSGSARLFITRKSLDALIATAGGAT